MPRIPKTLHYCFGSGRGRPWSLVNHACLRSAIERIRPDAVRFHFREEPTGPWWDATRPLVDPVRITGGVADPMAARLAPLLAEGGIFLAGDALVQRDFDPLLEFGAVVGIENVGEAARLGPGVILAEPGALFVRKWLAALGGTARLTVEPNDEAKILPFTAFHWPLGVEPHLEWLFETSDPIIPRQAFVRRLWQRQAWPHLAGLTPGLVRARETNACRLLRPFVADLPDDYGADGAPAPPSVRRAKADRAETVATVDRRVVFQEIYAQSSWGRDAERFFSGSGSRGSPAERYVAAMAAQLEALHRTIGRELVVVDIGCGDFFVGRALLAACPFIRYVGCDIVPELIAHHREVHGSERASFEVLDIVTDPPPRGDVCLVRQVFQHLSNADVLAGLDRLRGFSAIYLTEGNPVVRDGPVNPDKRASGYIRFGPRGVGRGIEWREPPFSLRTEEVLRTINPPLEVIVTERVWLD